MGIEGGTFTRDEGGEYYDNPFANDVTTPDEIHRPDPADVVADTRVASMVRDEEARKTTGQTDVRPSDIATPPSVDRPELGVGEAGKELLGALGRATKTFFFGKAPSIPDSEPANEPERNARKLTPTEVPGIALTPNGRVVNVGDEQRRRTLKVAGGAARAIPSSNRYEQ